MVASRKAQPTRWEPEFEPELKQQLARTLMESLSRESLGSLSTSSNSTNVFHVFKQFSEKSDLRWEKPPKSIDVGETLDSKDLERQKSELFLWLSSAFCSPAEKAPPVIPVPVPSPAPAEPCQKAPCLLANKLSLGSSFCGDSHGTNSTDRDFSLFSTSFPCLNDALNTAGGHHHSAEKFTEKTAIYYQQPRRMHLSVLTKKASEPNLYGTPSTSYASSPTMSPAFPSYFSENFQASPRPCNSIATGQVFDEELQDKLEPAHCMIAPPPGLEHLKPQCMQPRCASPISGNGA